MKTTLRLSAVILSILLFYSCKEKPLPPVISTTSVTDISTTTAVSGGVINDDGGASIISKGVCWNTSDDPTIENTKTTESGESTSFTSNLSQLTPATLYYIRAYATNSAGTGYGESVSFTTLGDEPASTASSASNITINSATLTGTVNPNLLSTTVTFEWGTSTSYGNTVTPTQSPVTGSTSVNVNTDLTGLTPGTIYHFRVKATNELGTTNSNDMAFTTLGQAPTVATQAVYVKIDTATLNGSINPNYLSTTITFEWGTSTSYGNTVTPTQSTLSGSTSVNVSVVLSGLTAETTYHFRIKATNELGTTYGEDLTFTTYTLVDIDKNYYHAVTISTQIWMKENLKTTKYTNGDLIETTSPATLDISTESTPKYQWAYSGDETNVATYGRLYTWYAITDSRNACPAGWHIPTDDEWTTLTNFVGGESIAGGKLKETGTSHWNSTNIDVTNESGFTALPGGNRLFYDSSFFGILYYGAWWSSTSLNSGSLSAYNRDLCDSQNNIRRAGWPKKTGCSVRCIKD